MTPIVMAVTERAGDAELVLVPIVGGNDDVGYGGGYILSLAKLDPEHGPYAWRLESASILTFDREDGALTIPYWDSYVLLDLPHVLRDAVRVQLRLTFTRESTLNYYGLGNASSVPSDRDPGDAYFKHLRIHPSASARAEYNLTQSWILSWGLGYRQNWFEIRDDTLLAEDMRHGSHAVRALLGEDAPHGVVQYSMGLAWDSRDSEVSPAAGQYHSMRLDLSPGGTDAIPYRFARFDVAARFYATLIEHRLVFAARALSDLLFGDPPFYELPRYDETSAIGGVNGVRGIPAQRYYGKIKLISNLELRSRLFDFELLGKNNSLGVTGFFDAGRVWADYTARRELDGSSLGLKYGLGAGLRVAAGSAFVLRFDVAWSRDRNPLAAYLAAGHVF